MKTFNTATVNIDFGTVKNGQIMIIDGVEYIGRVSGGRKMLQRDEVHMVEKNIPKIIRGWNHPQDREHRNTIMMCDYGRTVHITSRRQYSLQKGVSFPPYESYDLPTGKTPNRWDVYEYNRLPKT